MVDQRPEDAPTARDPLAVHEPAPAPEPRGPRASGGVAPEPPRGSRRGRPGPTATAAPSATGPGTAEQRRVQRSP